MGRSLMAPRAFRWSPNTTGNASWRTWMLRCGGKNISPLGVLVDSWRGADFPSRFMVGRLGIKRFFFIGKTWLSKDLRRREVRMKSSFCIYLSHCVDLFWTQWYCWAKSWCFKRTKSIGVTIGCRSLQAKRVELLGVVVGCLWEVGIEVLGASDYLQVDLKWITLPKTDSLHLKIDLWKRRFLLETTIFRCFCC